LSELIPRGVRFVTTSNTLPEQLGEGRFNAGGFQTRDSGYRRTLPDAARGRAGLPSPRRVAGTASDLERRPSRGVSPFSWGQSHRDFRRVAHAPEQTSPNSLLQPSGRCERRVSRGIAQHPEAG
ncbi:MAG: cell division protein ZapE, partial [Pleurocapsa sp. SU_196_0]|nr:cell division protein ZapE [Pleurocapsa sp. SU_196_0]